MIQSAFFSFSADSFDSMAGEEEEVFVIRRGTKACVIEQEQLIARQVLVWCREH
jgi:hypothetical protein